MTALDQAFIKAFSQPPVATAVECCVDAAVELPLAALPHQLGNQVDHFTWPKVCRRLIARAADELDRLADALLAANAKGQKVFAFVGCHPEEGATTLLLCAARRLAERGVKPVLVDADLHRPRLADRLGVQPQSGWNETAEEADTPLDRAIIEATANNVALLPAREPPGESGWTTSDPARLGPCIGVLRRHYDLVLVDLGSLSSCETMGIAASIDAVVLVHNQRITSLDERTEFEERLAAEGIALMGIINNFVAE